MRFERPKYTLSMVLIRDSEEGILSGQFRFCIGFVCVLNESNAEEIKGNIIIYCAKSYVPLLPSLQLQLAFNFE